MARRNSLTAGEIVGFTFGALFLALVVVALVALVTGWVFMLLAGALHNSVSEQVPAFGYWVSVLIAFVIRWVGNLLFGSRSTSSSN